VKQSILGALGSGWLDLVFAPACLGCSAPVTTAAVDRIVCATCWSRLRPLPLPRCARCWTPRPTGIPGIPSPPCATCAGLPPSLRAVRSAFVHASPLRELIHRLKYGGWWRVGEALGRRMAGLDWPEEVRDEARVVAPVPLSAARHRERGYNQALILANAVSVQTGWIVSPSLLRRARSAGSQTSLHPSERRANVASAFEVGPEHRAEIAGEHVVLVDDVWTTGATALACGDALLKAGARAYSVVTLARALPELNR
jgi:ComF family protein